MTATPTPLRELTAKWRERSRNEATEGKNKEWAEWVRERHMATAAALWKCADELEAALSARDEAGAVAWAADDFYSNHPLPVLHDDPAINMELLVQALTNRLDTARQALAAVAAMQVVQPALQQIKANAAWAMSETDPRRLLPRSVAYNTTPPAASGDDLIARLRIIATAYEPGSILRNTLDEAILRLAAVAPAGMDDGYYIASFKNGRSGDGTVLWWMPDNAGYSSDLEQAGIYRDLMPGYHDNEYTVPVPVSFIRNLRVRRVVDYGDSLNTAFHSAKSLRAILAAAAPTPPATAGKE